MTASYLYNRISHSAFKMETPYKMLYGKDADLSHLRIIKDAKKLGHTSWEGMVRGFSQSKSNSFRIWNPKTNRVVESRNVVFNETPPHLLPPSRRLSSLQGLEDPTFDFSDHILDDNYISREDMIQDVQDYTSVLDFDANDPAELLVPMQASPGGSSPGGVTPQGSPSSSASVPAPTLETAPAPAPVPAAQQATATGTNRYAMQPGVTRAVTRSQVRSPVATDDRANRNNRAAVAGLFQKDTLQQVHKLESHANLDIANQLDDTFSTEYAYATTNA